MPAPSPRAYVVGSVALRDYLIAELSAAGLAAVAGPSADPAAWSAAKDRPWLVFVRGEPVPDGIVARPVRRCHVHRDRTETVTNRGGMPPGAVRLCSECRAVLARKRGAGGLSPQSVCVGPGGAVQPGRPAGRGRA
ncbi:MAG TPA: hypothetical protein VGF55_17450 [Gemmataceae bacterium]|jgi:hypothetical protein